jgi:putative transposase
MPVLGRGEPEPRVISPRARREPEPRVICTQLFCPEAEPRVICTQLFWRHDRYPGMSLPRQVLSGSEYMITRRCSERRFFLRPDDETNNAFVYCLALAAQRAKVELLFAEAMSNHYHAGLHDPLGNFPLFSEHFHALLARCQNAHLGRFENFWSSDPTSVVRLVEPSDVLDKMVYAYTNPAAADLVDTAEEWPGVSTFQAARTTGHLVATRPKFFFRSDGNLPEVVTIPIARPHGFADQTQAEWNELVANRVRAVEAEHRERRRAAGKSVLGREAILRQDPFDSPKSPEPHFRISPRVAAKAKWPRIEAIGRSKAFVEKYRSAIKNWMAGVADVVFPYGTYWMRKFARVVCETAEAVGGAVAQAQGAPVTA